MTLVYGSWAHQQWPVGLTRCHRGTPWRSTPPPCGCRWRVLRSWPMLLSQSELIIMKWLQHREDDYYTTCSNLTSSSSFSSWEQKSASRHQTDNISLYLWGKFIRQDEFWLHSSRVWFIQSIFSCIIFNVWSDVWLPNDRVTYWLIWNELKWHVSVSYELIKSL